MLIRAVIAGLVARFSSQTGQLGSIASLRFPAELWDAFNAVSFGLRRQSTSTSGGRGKQQRNLKPQVRSLFASCASLELLPHLQCTCFAMSTGGLHLLWLHML